MKTKQLPQVEKTMFIRVASGHSEVTAVNNLKFYGSHERQA